VVAVLVASGNGLVGSVSAHDEDGGIVFLVFRAQEVVADVAADDFRPAVGGGHGSLQ
jgi:hypothetical protein